MPRFLYGSGYDSVAQQELQRDSARDQRFWNSVQASRALRQQMEDENYRAAAFQEAEQNRQAALDEQARYHDIIAAQAAARLKEAKARSDLVRAQQGRQLDLQALAHQDLVANNAARNAIEQSKIDVQKERINAGLNYRYQPSTANLVQMAALSRRDEMVADTAKGLAYQLNLREALKQKLDALPPGDKNRGAVRDQFDEADRIVKANRPLVGQYVAETYQDVPDPSAPGKTIRQKVYRSTFTPKVYTSDMLRQRFAGQAGTGAPMPAPQSLSTLPTTPTGAPTTTSGGYSVDALMQAYHRKLSEGYSPSEINAAFKKRLGVDIEQEILNRAGVSPDATAPPNLMAPDELDNLDQEY